jgi:hypothetical protein
MYRSRVRGKKPHEETDRKGDLRTLKKNRDEVEERTHKLLEMVGRRRGGILRRRRLRKPQTRRSRSIRGGAGTKRRPRISTLP